MDCPNDKSEISSTPQSKSRADDSASSPHPEQTKKFDQRRYHCSDCPPGSNAFDNGFRQKKQLAAHRAVVHKASRLCLPCPHPGCHQQFVCQSKLISHQRRHAVRRCEDCNAEFVGYSALRRHRALEHPAPIDCQRCGLRLACRALLRTHLAAAHRPGSDDAAPTHKCSYEGCGKVYTLAKNLQQHVRSRHLGVRFPCPRPGCTYSLCSGQKLRMHLLLHDRGRVMPPPVTERRRRRKQMEKCSTSIESGSRIGLLARENRRRRRRQTEKRDVESPQRHARIRLDSNASTVSSGGHDSDNSLVRLVC